MHLRDRGFLGASKHADTGIVDQQIDPAGLREHRRNERSDGRAVGYVANQHSHSVWVVADRAATCPEYRKPCPRQCLGAGSADAGGGSGHERGLS